MDRSHYRTLGRTGLSVSPIALGTVELGMDYGIPVPGQYGRPSSSAAERLVGAALDAGINFIDTAQAYGNSEAVLGRALRGRRKRVVLATKATVQADGKTLRGEALRRAMLSGLEHSLRSLNTDYVDIWQIHNVDADLLDQADLVAEVFSEARASGMILWRGGSFYGPDLPLAALELELFDAIQVTYSLFDQRLATRVFPTARRRGVGVMVRSVLLQGVLTERADYLPDWLEPLKARSRRFRQLVAEAGRNPRRATGGRTHSCAGSYRLRTGRTAHRLSSRRHAYRGRARRESGGGKHDAVPRPASRTAPATSRRSRAAQPELLARRPGSRSQKDATELILGSFYGEGSRCGR